MSSSLVSERPLLISPALAATIGLEEACMLSLLSDIAHYGLADANTHWLALSDDQVQRLMPFWQDYDIQRISQNLRDKGVIQLASAPFCESRQFLVALDTRQHLPPSSHQPPATRLLPGPPVNQGANLIPPHWQPDRDLLAQLAQLGVPQTFAQEQLPEFIVYWRERGDSKHSWGSAFIKHIKHLWETKQSSEARKRREEQAQQQRDRDTEFLQRDQDTAMHSQWRPSRDALELLVKHAAISLAFVEDAIPEFVVYWQERGDVGRTWNSRFIQHVKRQWLRYKSALEHDSEPRRLPPNWQPSRDLFDVLKLANIDLTFAQQQLPEFMMFWRDSNQLHSSWNTKFLQHVKHHWAKQHALASSAQVNTHAGLQQPQQHRSTRDRSLVEDLTDRSWAN